MIDEGKAVDFLYKEFTKVFHKILHDRHIQKIKAHGILDLVDWIQKLSTVLKRCYSDWRSLSSKVQQGSYMLDHI